MIVELAFGQHASITVTESNNGLVEITSTKTVANGAPLSCTLYLNEAELRKLGQHLLWLTQDGVEWDREGA